MIANISGELLIDEPAAWAMVRSVRELWPGKKDSQNSISIAASGNPLIELHVSTGGSWQSAAAVTEAAASLLDLYLPLCATQGEAHVMAQMGQSVDGRIATESGHSQYVTGKADIVHLHRLRALCDAVLVGAGTAMADNPRLTVRHATGSSPVRALIDPGLRVPTQGHLFQDGATPTLVLCDAGRIHGEPEARPGVQWLVLEDLAPAAILQQLAQLGLRRLLVEGGGRTVSGFLAAGVLDRLHVTIAPLIIGSGRHGLSLPVIDTLDQARRPGCRHFTLGDDILFDFNLRASS